MKKIYAYSTPLYPTLIKVGQTTGDVEERVREQFQQHPLGIYKPYTILFIGEALSDFGDEFSDIDVHRQLMALGITRVCKDKEWFECKKEDVEKAFNEVRKSYKCDYTYRNINDMPPITKLVLFHLARISVNSVVNFLIKDVAGALSVSEASVKRAKKYLIFNGYISKRARSTYFILNNPFFSVDKAEEN